MKRFICFLTIFTILLSSIFVNVKSVYAISDVDSALNILKTIRESINDSPSNDPGSTWLSIMYPVGVLIPEKWQSTTYSTIQDWIRSYSTGGHGFDDLSNASDSDVQSAIGQFILDNSTDNSVNNNFRDLIIYLNDKIESDSVSYLYSYKLSEFGSARNVPTGIYLKLQEVISVASDLSNTIFIVSGSGSNISYASIDLSSVPYLYARRVNSSGIDYYCQLYNGFDNTLVSPAFGKWNATNGDFSSDGGSNANILGFTQYGVSSITPPSTFGSGVPCFVSRNVRKSIRLFSSAPSANDLLYAPYYYNNSVWQDFSQSTGDYTLSNSNINTVTYGDTISYIDSFNQTEGVPPTTFKIDTWIENQNVENTTPTQTPTPTGTPGGDDSSDDGSGSNIFDVLTRLGQAIGNLISGIGSFLTGIVEGLVSAVTSLLSKLSELITGTLESLTNIFSGLISFVYAGLPEEVQGLLLLCLTMALLVTVIQLIRGK